LLNIQEPVFSLHINVKNLERIPYGIGGLYTLYDKDFNIIYIGKSVNIFDRVRGHVCGKTHTKYFHKEISYICFFHTDSRTEQDIYETYLINIYRPKYNKDKVYNETPSQNQLKSFGILDLKTSLKIKFVNFVVKLLKINRNMRIYDTVIEEICRNNKIDVFSIKDKQVEYMLSEKGVKFDGRFMVYESHKTKQGVA
jgi:hypothetical protein